MNRTANRTAYLDTHAAVQGLEDWMLETESPDTLTVQAIANCAMELRADLRDQHSRYADGYELDTAAHRVAVSIVANVLAWTEAKLTTITRTATSMPSYRVHLVRFDGQPIDTSTGTLTYSVSYYRNLNRRTVNKPATIVARFNEDMRGKGYMVDRIEIYHFDPTA